MTDEMVARADRSTAEGQARPWWGVVVSGVVVTFLAIGAVGDWASFGSDFGILVAIALVGLIAGLLVARRPRHPISWLLTASALAGGFAALTAGFLPPGLTKGSWWQEALAIVSGPSWYALLFSVLCLIPLWFPTGRPPSPRWRWVGWLGSGALVLMATLWMVQERFCTETTPDGACLSTMTNPIGIRGVSSPEESVIGGVLFGLLILCILASLLSLAFRYRSAPGIERRQIKWVAFSVGLFVGVTAIVEYLWMGALDRPEPTGYALVQQFLWVAIPAAIAVAILRYRLYEIDRIVSRTVSYALLVAILALAFSGAAALVGTRVSEQPVFVAAATLVAAALFQPLRRRIQSVVDRRFNRSRYNTERVMEGFVGSLRHHMEPDSVLEGWVDVVQVTMQPGAVGLWVKA